MKKKISKNLKKNQNLKNSQKISKSPKSKFLTQTSQKKVKKSKFQEIRKSFK